MYTLPDLHKHLLIEMMKSLDALLLKNNISYFIDGGSLLGSVRSQGIIPWDDDIDIGVLNGEWGRLVNYIDDMTKITYQVAKEEGSDELVDFKPEIQRCSDGMIKVFIKGLWCEIEDDNDNDKKHIIGTPTIDIFRWEIKKDIIRLANLNHRRTFKNCCYLKKEMFPMSLHLLDGLLLRGAKNAIPYLTRYYGPDWEKPKYDSRDNTNPLNKNRNDEN